MKYLKFQQRFEKTIKIRTKNTSDARSYTSQNPSSYRRTKKQQYSPRLKNPVLGTCFLISGDLFSIREFPYFSSFMINFI